MGRFCFLRRTSWLDDAGPSVSPRAAAGSQKQRDPPVSGGPALPGASFRALQRPDLSKAPPRSHAQPTPVLLLPPKLLQPPDSCRREGRAVGEGANREGAGDSRWCPQASITGLPSAAAPRRHRHEAREATAAAFGVVPPRPGTGVNHPSLPPSASHLPPISPHRFPIYLRLCS